MEKSKKIKIDMNPKRVQNRSEIYKRSPGKFDQKVYMEQELATNQAVTAAEKLSRMQKDSVVLTLQKEMSNLRKLRNRFESQNTNYSYIKQIRNAVFDEHTRRQSMVQYKELEQQQAELEAELARQKAEEEARLAAQPKTNYRPWEKDSLPKIHKKETQVKNEGRRKQLRESGHPISQPVHANREDLLSRSLPEGEMYKLSSHEKSMLEKVSTDIVKGTFPVNKLKKLLPTEETSNQEKYPIMSAYRKNSLMPEVRKIKRQMNTDVVNLHTRIENYFGEKVPLATYFIPKSAKPRKYQILRAISSDEFNLPPTEFP